MYTLQADIVFNNKNFFEKLNFENEHEIHLDFKAVQELNLDAINILLKIQKLAIFNNYKILFKNLSPKLADTLDKTGIYKTFNMTNPIKMNKRLSLFDENK